MTLIVTVSRLFRLTDSQPMVLSPAARVAGTNSAHSWHTMLVVKTDYRTECDVLLPRRPFLDSFRFADQSSRIVRFRGAPVNADVGGYHIGDLRVI